MTLVAAFRRLLIAVFVVGAVLAPSAVFAVDELLEEARAYFQKGQINAGVIQLKNVLKEDPNHAEARYLLGLSYLRIGDLLGAEKELRRARELGWDRGEVVVPLAQSILYRGDYGLVLDEFNVDDGDPESVRADLLALRGIAQLQTNDLKSAEDSLAQSLKLNPDGREAVLGFVQLAMVQRDFPRAEEFIEKALANDPTRAQSWLTKAHILRIQKKASPAVEAYNKVLELQPNNFNALVGRAASLLTLDEIERAREDITATLELEPRHPLGNYLLAQLLLRDGALADALAPLSIVLQILPDHGPAQLLHGQINYNLGNLSQSEDSLDRYVKSNPTNVPVVKLLAAVKTRLGKIDQTIALLEPLVEKPEIELDAQFFALLGSALLRDGEFEKGSAYLGRASELAPESTGIRTQLAISHLASGDTDVAINELKSAVDLGPDTMHADFVLAMTYVREKKFELALETASNLTERRPDDPVGFNLLGVVNLAAGDLGQARAAFDQQLKVDPTATGAQINLARIDASEEKYDSAKKRYLGLIESEPNNLKALLGMVALAERENDAAEQRRWLERAWSANPESIETGARLVSFYLKSGQRLQALNLARDVKSRSPQNSTALNAMGLALVANNEIASAIDNFVALTRANPQSARAWHLLAHTQFRGERWRGARDSTNRVLKLNPQFPPALELLAQLDLRAKRYSEAESTITHLIGLRPEGVAGYRLLGEFHRLQKQYVPAIGAYRKALSIDANSATARALAAMHWEAGEREAAADVLTKWTEANPDDSPARLQLAAILEQESNKEIPISEYRRVLTGDPNNIIALNNLAWHLAEQGDPDAIKYAERAVELAPNRAEVTDTLGWILIQNDELNRGLIVLQQAAIQAPDMLEIRYHLGVVLDRLGRMDEAIEHLEAALADGPEYPGLDDAQALLAQLRQKRGG